MDNMNAYFNNVSLRYILTIAKKKDALDLLVSECTTIIDNITVPYEDEYSDKQLLAICL